MGTELESPALGKGIQLSLGVLVYEMRMSTLSLRENS